MGILYRTKETENSYLIAFDYEHMPIPFDDINEWCLYCFLFSKENIIIETPLEYNDTDFNIEKYNKLLLEPLSCTYYIMKYKLFSKINKDNSELIKKYFVENNDLVKQYKNGNIKVINQIMGKILKDDKSLDPKSLKNEIEELLKLV